ncbi:ABC transporter substrate-binding protein [Rhizobium leguminosarum]|uniref:ABC transporter substrate-binding protein n=1 Tax=Rhizobium leguminosarum TaxID=384 RepID=UPI003ED1620A
MATLKLGQAMIHWSKIGHPPDNRIFKSIDHHEISNYGYLLRVRTAREFGEPLGIWETHHKEDMMNLKRRDLLKIVAAGGIASAGTRVFAQSEGPLRIGVLCDFSSVASTSGGKGSVAAVELAVEDFGGQALGRQIEIVSADHQGKAEIATGIAREWMDTKGVEAFFDLQISSCALAVMALAANKNKIAVVSNAHSSQITGKSCNPTSFHWTYDTYGLSTVQPDVFVKMGKKRWFLLNPDYAFGISLENDFKKSLEGRGATVTGSLRVPLGSPDFSTAVLAAANSGADVVQVGLFGTDLLNFIKTARQFGLDSVVTLATTSMSIVDVQVLGLESMHGLYANEVFYWDQNDKTRDWSKRYMKKMGSPPNGERACGYSAVMHYLKAVAQAGVVDATQVAKAMRSIPVNDMMSNNLTVREDGMCVRDFHLFKVKAPEASKYDFDMYDYVSTVAGPSTVRSPSESECALIKS